MKSRAATPNVSVNANPRSFGRASGIFRSQSGQSLLEVALLTPLLLAMVLGAIEIGRYAYLAILVGNAAHAGALYAAQGVVQATPLPNSPLANAGITQAADNDFQNNGQIAANLVVYASNACGCDSQGTITPEICTSSLSPTAGICPVGSHWEVTVSVTAKDTFQSLFSYPWIPNKITVSRTSTMRVALY